MAPESISALAAVVAVLVSLYATWQSRRKVSAETQEAYSQGQEAATIAYTTLVEPLERRVKQLEETTERQAEKIRRLERENRELVRGVTILSGQIAGLGHEPAWTPNRDLEDGSVGY